MRALRALARLLRDAGVRDGLRLFALMLAGGLTDGVGVLLLVPLLELAQAGTTPASGAGATLLAAAGRLGIAPAIGPLLACFVGLVVLRSLVQVARDREGARLEHGVVDRLRERCFRALMAAEWRWLAQRRESDHAAQLLGEVSRVGVGLHFALTLLASAVTIAAYLAAAAALSWRMTGLAVLGAAAAFALLGGLRRRAIEVGEALGRANRALQRDVQESLAGIRLAKILGQEQRHVEHLMSTVEDLRLQQQRFLAGSGLSTASLQVGGAALLVAYLYAGLRYGHAPLSAMLTLVVVFGRLLPLCVQAQTALYQCLNALPALEATGRLLEECRLSAEPAVVPRSTAPVVRGSLTLDRVTVRHAGRDRPALADVSITFAARTTTAVIGASGAGKSTLADVLMGLLPPDAGALRLDGVAVEGERRMAWRHAVSYVPQETFLFHDTIRNNLRWAAPDADDAALRAALQRACADFVFELPEQLDTVVGDRGSRLSGGERQRLALARALLSRPALLILDEATSALDVENERRVREAIEGLHGDLTVVLIGHRLPTLEHADQVVVLDGGRLVAQGGWREVREALANADVALP